MPVRFARPDDYPEMLRIYGYYVENTAITFDYDVPDLGGFAEKINKISAQYPCLVYETAGGNIAGYTYASKFREKTAYQWSVESTIYLNPEYTGQGIGKELYARLFELLTKMRIQIVIGGITIPNDSSIGLHKYFGFEQTAIFRSIGYKFDQWHDIVFMEKRLCPAEKDPLPPLALTIIKES
jgi:phosphinothricin acetyltransferase